MDILESLKWRYATKKFDNEALIPEKDIQLIKEAFNLTATSYGLQPIKLLVIQNKELQKQLVPHSMNQQQVAQASHVLVFCIVTDIDSNYIESYFERVKDIRETPDTILKPFREYLIDDFKGKSTEKIEDWTTKQAYLAMGNLLTVCAVEGIDACPMEGFEPAAFDELLDLSSKNLKSVLVMPIGYRAEDDPFAEFKKVRKDLAESTINYP